MSDRFALLAALEKEGNALAFARRFTRLSLAKPHLDTLGIAQLLASFGDQQRGRDWAAELAGERIKVTTILDDDFPFMLKHISDPPLVLFYSGSLASVHRPCISLVGSRNVTNYGRQVTRQLAGELGRLGFTVVSGLALGVDAAAHEACLEVGGSTAGVLGSGIDCIYPAEHRGLAKSMVLKRGTVISEHLPGCPPLPFHFPIRNRLISGLSHATIVVEARKRSGSLITARHCLDQGRELFAVPGQINYLQSQGANGLIHRGEARLLLSCGSILEELGPLLGLAAESQQALSAQIENPVAQKIYQRLDAFEPIPLDLLVAELQLETGTALAHLVNLENRNLVESRPGQNFVRNPLASPRVGAAKTG